MTPTARLRYATLRLLFVLFFDCAGTPFRVIIFCGLGGDFSAIVTSFWKCCSDS